MEFKKVQEVESNQREFEDESDQTDSLDGDEEIPLIKEYRKQKMQKSSELPKKSYFKNYINKGFGRTGRYNRSYILRNAKGKYPTEIHDGVKGYNSNPIPINHDKLKEPFAGLLEILRDYMGHDPASLTFPALENRILLSTKAEDESDSEHFQRIASTLQILDTIKKGRVGTLGNLVSWAQKEKNDDRQHERYSQAIQNKSIRSIAEASKLNAEVEKIKFDNQKIKEDDKQLGYLKRKQEEIKLRHEINYYNSLPRTLIDDINFENVDDNFLKKQAYLQKRIC